MEIKIQVEGDKIKSISKNDTAAGNLNSYRCSFSFDDAWKSLIKVAVFIRNDTHFNVPLTENSCAVPFDILNSPGSAYVGAFGYDKKDDTSVRISAVPKELTILRGSFSAESVEPKEGELEIWEKAVADAVSARDEAQQAAEDAETAKDTAVSAAEDTVSARDIASKAAATASDANTSAIEAKNAAEAAKEDALAANTDTANYWLGAEQAAENAGMSERNAKESATAAETARDEAVSAAENAIGKAPYIGENKNWWIYNGESGIYLDSNVKATGEKGDKGDPGEKGEAGTTDHSQLTNLDYDNSGHTGFQRAFTEEEQAWFDIIPVISSNATGAIEGLGKEITARETKDTEIEATANEALAIAKGANQALTFGSYEAMYDDFVDICATPEGKNKYPVGNNVLIRTLDVPDLWVYEIRDDLAFDCMTADGVFCGDDAFVELLKTNEKIQIGYYVFSALETQKVELNEYATKEEVEAITPVVVTNTTDVWYLENNKQYIITVPLQESNGYQLYFLIDTDTVSEVLECSAYIKPVSETPYILTSLNGEENATFLWFGDECDETGVFTPQANTHYEIHFKRMGNDDSGNPFIIARVGAWQ